MSIRQPYPVSSGGGSGDVVGPASSTNNNVVFFDGTTGKLIKDSGLTLSGSNTGDQTITSSDSSLTVSTNDLVLNVGHSNTWTVLQTFNPTMFGLAGAVSGTKKLTVASTTGGSWLIPGSGSDTFVGRDDTATITNKTISAPTITGVATLDESASIGLDPSGSADEVWSGISVSGTAGATIAVGDICYLDVTAGEWLLADASAASTAGSVILGLCITASTDGNPTRLLLNGTIRSAAFPASIALGAPLYVSETAGDITATQPTTTDAVIRVVGWAITTEPNTIYFNPSPDYITHT